MADVRDINIDMSDITLDEMAEIEEATGSAWRNIDWENLGTKELKLVGWIFGRRDDPDFTLEDAGKLRIRNFVRPAEVAAEADPTPLHSANGVA